MGYTTEFDGAFKVTPEMSAETITAIMDLYEGDLHIANSPGGYCQWVVSEDASEIEWDGEEKFYDWDLWLKAIIENLLAPHGYKVNGRVRWQGEDTSDCGWLVVKDNVVSAIPVESTEEAAKKLAEAAQKLLMDAVDRGDCFPGEDIEDYATITDEEGRVWFQDWYHLYDALRAEAIQNILIEVM